MITHIVRESSSGKLYALSVCAGTRTRGADDPYRQFARDVLKMPGTEDPGFDTGNVDIDVFEVPPSPRTVPVVFDGDEETP